MTTHPKPGNEPDQKDMSGALDIESETPHPSATLPNRAEEAEEEAARLGDFA
ncbi:hypothetical protein [Sphingosinicella sp. BN140058]|uniref:hypothetical protein n=1 Tax=Sphingosinicella sp. BN140058 TaxID=1892855 RepID=UPI0013EC316A|nr:hypothetical protein [Sphingosinicella sp. BN140058]